MLKQSLGLAILLPQPPKLVQAQAAGPGLSYFSVFPRWSQRKAGQDVHLQVTCPALQKSVHIIYRPGASRTWASWPGPSPPSWLPHDTRFRDARVPLPLRFVFLLHLKYALTSGLGLDTGEACSQGMIGLQLPEGN